MEKYHLQNDVKVFGFQVKNFPDGVGEAFDALIKMLPPAHTRPFYGISECSGEGVVYIAAAEETFDGEGKKYGCENYIVEKGEYISASLVDWTSKTHCIKDVFEEIVKDKRVDKTQPAIEVYKNMKEMICMVKIDQRKEVQSEFDTTMEELIPLVASLSNEQLNTIPFQDSWTAGQLAQHLIKANAGFLQLINGPVKETERTPDAMVETFRTEFTDYNLKRTSPEAVRPGNKTYITEELLQALEAIKASIDKALQALDLTKTCAVFELPVYGFITRLEGAWFVTYHTQRHIQQPTKIMQKIGAE